MSDTFQCGDNTALVGYLYDECEPGERAAIDAHIALCAACAAEVAALAVGATAACVLDAARGGPGLRHRQASGPLRAQGCQAEPQAAPGPEPEAWGLVPPADARVGAGGCGLPDLWRRAVARRAARQHRRTRLRRRRACRDEQRRVAGRGARQPISRRSSSGCARRWPSSARRRRARPPRRRRRNNAQILAQVRALIDESEQRQQRELALRTAQVVRDFDSQRRVDLAQIQRNFGQIEGLTGAEVREQRQMLNYLMRVSEQR